ncbi:hypothetical protein V2J09_023482 [Rumex salicifolius]
MSPSTSLSPSLDQCLKLLRGERDEQRLAGLLLVTKFCDKDDQDSIRRVYEAVGVQFLDRLLRTGMGEGIAPNNDNQDAYLQLSVTILSAFCRVPDIAASEDMVKKIPLMLEIMTKESASSFREECYEFLLLVSSSSEDGAVTLHEFGALKVLANQMPTLSDGSRLLEISLRITLLIFSKVPLDVIIKEYTTDVFAIVASITRQFAVLQDALKFELLHLLSIVLSSNSLGHLHNSITALPNSNWTAYIRMGIVDVLQNRVAPDQKLQAITLAESMVSMVGANWLISHIDVPGLHNSVPYDRCLLLVLETSRVEVAVLLNDLAYLKYEASSSKAEDIPIKQRILGIAFSLIETIIKLISTAGESEGGVISDSTITKVISGLNETIGVVLEYLKDAKEHGQRKGDDLLACVRVVGSYLAEAPLACKEKVNELLGYMLSVEGGDEPSPFLSVCFLLPMLCQTTMEIEGCKVLALSGGYRAIVQCLVRLITSGPYGTENNGGISLACDTIMNLLLKREQIHVQLDESALVHLLKNLPLTLLPDKNDNITIVMMASSICSLILDILSEEILLRYPDFGSDALDSLSHVIVKSLATCGQEMCDDSKSDADLHELIFAGYSRWADRYPHIRRAVER